MTFQPSFPRRGTWFLNGFRPPLRSLAGFAIGLLLTSFSAQKVSAATSGPGAFGYRDKDNAEPGGPVFSFEGISGSGAVPIDSEDLFATPSVQIRAVSDHFSTPSPSQP
ncbi:MAG: hypothetical protein DVB22_000286 [Verrucomicrobia bacterium]|nr:MAG: hypothetical protein DVB22_000286 [Verrucomicrobiota bacterium]